MPLYRTIRLDVIDRIRLEKGWQKAKLLKAMGMSHKTYNALDRSRVHDSTILKLSKMLDLEISEFVEYGG